MLLPVVRLRLSGTVGRVLAHVEAVLYYLARQVVVGLMHLATQRTLRNGPWPEGEPMEVGTHPCPDNISSKCALDSRLDLAQEH